MTRSKRELTIRELEQQRDNLITSVHHDPMHVIVVRNIGTTYTGTNRQTAEQTYNDYVRMSKDGIGRAGGELVTWITDNEIVARHYPPPTNNELDEHDQLIADDGWEDDNERERRTR